MATVLNSTGLHREQNLLIDFIGIIKQHQGQSQGFDLPTRCNIVLFIQWGHQRKTFLRVTTEKTQEKLYLHE